MRARGGGAILVSTSSSVKEPVPNLGLSNVLARPSRRSPRRWRSSWPPTRSASTDHPRPHRHRSGAAPRRDQRQEAGCHAEEAKKRALATIPLGRYGETDEFGRVGAFLLSDAAAYMTGATVQVDGGLIRSVV